MRVQAMNVPVFLLGRLVPCDALPFNRHYVAVDQTGDLHCLESIGGMLHVCIDELNYRWEHGEV